MQLDVPRGVMALLLPYVPEVDIMPVIATSGEILRSNPNALRTLEDLRTIRRLPWDGFVCAELSDKGFSPLVVNSIRVGVQKMAEKVFPMFLISLSFL